MLHPCPQCLEDTDFICKGHDADGKIFDLYSCPNCKSHIRYFPMPPPVTLVAVSLSDKPEQMSMFPKGRVSD